ncbi:accessory gene regulator B family protein [Anaerocolumna aminovalerica]|nr:accessory gene regulator B family protein [Anaerocolumna aminovalerica]
MESIIFLIVFIVTRQYCGGYHAKTFHGCILSFIFSYIIVLLLLELIFEKIELHHAILMLLFYMLTILKYAPIENKSKSLTNEIKQINHKKSIIIGIIWSFLSLGLFSYTRTISLMVILTLSLITVLILIEKVRKEG